MEGEGLAAIQAQLLNERSKLIVELGLDGGLAEQKQIAGAAKEARKRGAAAKKDKSSSAEPVMARRSLR